ncbi:uncharacterized protein E0L32_010493 [Thyridium curvatum]|uniref:Uncharacterized protein n=1 Tax=Thyridium curvatum TaxID=1093900 RepID=A0A507AML3_9PEZI|nr:uncharacterized protein E0L32_010493 [Thyridium curvatum]TPX07806.1 hypothetical protein E0L32_010493 [Thyridium curvatum]
MFSPSQGDSSPSLLGRPPRNQQQFPQYGNDYYDTHEQGHLDWVTDLTSSPPRLGQELPPMKRSKTVYRPHSNLSTSSRLTLPGGDGGGYPMMERSESNTSIRYRQAQKRGAKEVLLRQNKNATRALLIQPRPVNGRSSSSSSGRS